MAYLSSALYGLIISLISLELILFFPSADSVLSITFQSMQCESCQVTKFTEALGSTEHYWSP